MPKPIIFSFFAGSGFLDLGFEHQGFDVQFINEIHRPFVDAYIYSRQQMGIAPPALGYSHENIEYYASAEGREALAQLLQQARQTGALVGFIGGPPCPDFSVGGKNKGSEGKNGRLTRVYVELITTLKPDFFIFENVKGLWRTKSHRAFYDEMKVQLQTADYVLTDRLTNCIEFGAPQDRDRILMFGVRKAILPDTIPADSLAAAFDWEKYLLHDRQVVLNKNNWPQTDDFIEDVDKAVPSYVNGHEPLTVQYWFKQNDVENHPNTSHCFTPRNGLSKFKIVKEGDDSKKSYKRLHRWRYSPTAAYGNNEVHLHPYKARRLTVAEALAIQSLPKNFQLPPTMTLSDMFKTIGNGVPYLAACGLAHTVQDFLNKLPASRT
jgi:DNA (cytosine-5)-methyltransferase 1